RAAAAGRADEHARVASGAQPFHQKKELHLPAAETALGIDVSNGEVRPILVRLVERAGHRSPRAREGRVQARIVVGLELAVDFEEATASGEVAEQALQTA